MRDLRPSFGVPPGPFCIRLAGEISTWRLLKRWTQCWRFIFFFVDPELPLWFPVNTWTCLCHGLYWAQTFHFPEVTLPYKSGVSADVWLTACVQLLVLRIRVEEGFTSLAGNINSPGKTSFSHIFLLTASVYSVEIHQHLQRTLSQISALRHAWVGGKKTV